MISAIGADPSSDSPRIRHYLRVKGVADEYLRSSGLDYTILAPGTLTDEGGTGKITAAERLGCHGTLPREDLSQGIIEVLRNYNTLKNDSDDFRRRSHQESSCNGFGRGCSSTYSLTFLQMFQLRLVGRLIGC